MPSKCGSWQFLTTGAFVVGVLILTACKTAALGGVDQACSSTAAGYVDATFRWAPGAAANSTQYLDVSLYQDFPPGLFVGAGPLPSNQTTYSWPGLIANTTHYWRINTLVDGIWYTPATGTFTTLACGAAPPSSNMTARVQSDGIYVNDRKVTDNAADESPSFSPDGTTVAFDRCTPTEHAHGPPCSICLVGTDGSNLHCLSENGIEPHWLPSGNLIAFRSLTPNLDGGWAVGIGLCDVSTGVTTHLPNNTSYFGGFGPSPDGQFLLLASETNHLATVVNLAGDVVTQFNDPAYIARGWSRDGRVFFTEGIGGYWGWGNIADGSITPGSGCRCGSAEGDTIVFAGNYQSRYPWGYTLCEFMGG